MAGVAIDSVEDMKVTSPYCVLTLALNSSAFRVDNELTTIPHFPRQMPIKYFLNYEDISQNPKSGSLEACVVELWFNASCRQ